MTEYQEVVNRINDAKSDIGAAIAEKGVTVPAGTKIDAMASLIEAIQTGIELPTLTNEGAAADLLSGKQLIDAEGNIVNGSMPSVTQATPSISVSTGGLITASATQSAGKVAAGTKSATHQLTVQAAQTITPGTANKTIASGRYLTGTQTIKGDANLIAENIKSGVSIFGVAGSLEAGGSTGGGVPMAIGKITSSADTNELVVTHNLGVVPNFAIFNVESSYSTGGGNTARQAIQFYRAGNEKSNWTVYVSSTGSFYTSTDSGQKITDSAPSQYVFAATIYGATEREIRWGSAAGKTIIRAARPIYWMVAKIPEEMRVS